MNKYVDRDYKNKHHLKGIAIFATIVVVGSAGVFRWQKLKGVGSLSAESQTSLIQVETEAVKSNAKPLQVAGSLLKEWDRLNDSNQQLAADLIYTSVQNTTVYYNNAVLLMQGEIEYNRTKNNSLSATDNSAWVLGFVQDIENNSLKSYNLSKARILVLPDFQELSEKVGKDSTTELREFLKIAAETQKFKVFTDDEVNVKEAAKAYKHLIDETATFARSYPSSKYLSDLSSLARVYHDSLFGYYQTNNVTLGKDGKYAVSKSQLKDLKSISEDESSPLRVEAQKYLAQVKDGKISPDYLKAGSESSLKLYGSNVFWQSETDIGAIINSDGTSDLNNTTKGATDDEETQAQKQ